MSKDLVRAPSHSLPDKQSLADLLARVEAATTENPKLLVGLACDIHAELVAAIPKGYERGSSSGRYLMAHGRGGRTWSEEVPGYCSSIDAALALAERCLSGVRGLRLFQQPNGWMADLTEEQDSAFARTAPLAILAALLHALSDKERDAPPPKSPQGREGA